MSAAWAVASAAGAAAVAVLVNDGRRRPPDASASPPLVVDPAAPPRWGRLRETRPRPRLPEVAGFAAGAGLVFINPAMAAVVLAGALISVFAERRQARRARVLDSRAAVRAAIGAVAAALRAGLPPLTAWSSLVPEVAADDAATLRGGDDPLLRPVAVAARLGLDVSAALEEVARRPGAEALRRVAVCWRVSEGAGNGLAGALERLVEGLRDDEELRGTVDAELASARATGRLLAALPVIGVAGAAALGTPPRELLLGSSVGRVCTLAGAVLEVGGLLWLRRLARSVG